MQPTVHQLASQSYNYIDEEYWEPDQTYTLTLEDKDVNAVSMTNTTKHRGEKFYAKLHLSSTGGGSYTPIACQIDTAATCNTIPDYMLDYFTPKPNLLRSTAKLSPYSGPAIIPLGRVQLVCSRNNKYTLLEFQVIPSTKLRDKPALISGSDSSKLGLVEIHADIIHALSTSSQSLSSDTVELSEANIKQMYPTLWDGIGKIDSPVNFKLKPDVTPRQAPTHRVPVAMHDKVCMEIERLVKTGQLVKVEEPTDWCSNMLARERPGKLRLCIDPSQTINLAIERPTYQMPTLEENLHKLKRAKFFSMVDVREAFQHIPLMHESSLLTTMRTPKGRYRWTRMPFGVSSAPEEFQRRIHEHPSFSLQD